MAGITLLVSACAGLPVEIKDVTVYGSLGRQGAVVLHTQSTQTSLISSTDFLTMWMNPGRKDGPLFCMTATSFAEIKREQELLCSYYGKCSQQVLDGANAFYGRVQAVRARSLVVE